MFKKIPGFGKVPGNVQEDPEECSNVHEDSGECLRGFRRTLKKITNVKSTSKSDLSLLYCMKQKKDQTK